MYRKPRIAKTTHFPISNLLQSNDNQDNLVLGKEQTHRSMEYKWVTKNKTMYLWSVDFNPTLGPKLDGPKTINEKRTVFSINGVGTIGIRHLPHTIYKN